MLKIDILRYINYANGFVLITFAHKDCNNLGLELLCNY